MNIKQFMKTIYLGEIVFYIESYNYENQYQETTVSLHAKEMCLEDPCKNKRIYE